MDLQGKRIIVTGSARGIGAATVRAYARAGADVIGMDLNDEIGLIVAADAHARGPGTAGYVHVDISNKDSVEAAFTEAVDRIGGLDVLANPAAIKRASDTGKTDAGHVGIEDWDRIFAVNVRGTMIVNQVAYRHIKAAGGGSIINFGSISGQRPEPSAAAYSSSKGAVHSWTRTAASAWGSDNIRVNAVLPAIRTPMFDETYASFTKEEKTTAYWRNFQSIAMGGAYGDPDQDLSPVMVFLASDSSRFISGQLIPVDGGQSNVR